MTGHVRYFLEETYGTDSYLGTWKQDFFKITASGH